jgi:protein-L-isoaspartate(D-aspartate) O-methyltransferase
MGRRGELNIGQLCREHLHGGVSQIGFGTDDGALATSSKWDGLERAVGVIYRPESELASYLFEAVRPERFDESSWIDRTGLVEPFDVGSCSVCPRPTHSGL